MSSTKVILLACGSFNPITNMHLRMFELARDFLNRTGKFTVVAGIISPVNDGYDKADLLPATDRCAMVSHAINTSSWIRLDRWECEQPHWLPTAQVLKHFRTVLENTSVISEKPAKKRRLSPKSRGEFIDITATTSPVKSPPQSEPPSVKLLCGADLLESFSVPNLWKESDMEYIVSQHGLVCVTRSGSNPQKFVYESDLLTKYQDNIHLVTEWMHNDISSTKIRRALKRNESVKYLVQDSVIDYISEHGLYGYTNNKLVNHTIPEMPPDVRNDSKHTQQKIVSASDSPSYTISRDNSCHSLHRSPPVSHGVAVSTVTDTRAVPDHIVVDPQRKYKTIATQCALMSSAVNRRSSSPMKTSLSCVCGASDLNGLLKRMRNARIAWTTETCV